MGYAPMPRGIRTHGGTKIDPTPTGPGGVPINPPVIHRAEISTAPGRPWITPEPGAVGQQAGEDSWTFQALRAEEANPSRTPPARRSRAPDLSQYRGALWVLSRAGAGR